MSLYRRCFLISFPIVIILIGLTVFLLRPREPASPESTTLNRARIESAMSRGRHYFMESVSGAYGRVMKTGKPIQVDLYILAHYLQYQKQLGFAPDWNQRIRDYFLNSFGQGIWEDEGCMSVKVLIGFWEHQVDPDKIKPLTTYYADFIAKEWGAKGVGECFSNKVVRTYGRGFSEPYCTGPTRELDAKVAYYQNLVRDRSDNPLLKVLFPQINETRLHNYADAWQEIIPEVWLMMTYYQPGQTQVSRERFEIGSDKVKRTLKRIHDDQEFREFHKVSTFEITLLLYAYLLSGQQPDAVFDSLFNEVLASQRADGSFPSRWGKIKDHNIEATPTYFALLLMDKYLESYSST